MSVSPPPRRLRFRPRPLPADPDAPEQAMPLMAHLLELRNRLVRAALGIAITTTIAFIYSQQLLDLYLAARPHDLTVTIQAVKVTETFVTYFRVALNAGLIASMPIII